MRKIISIFFASICFANQAFCIDNGEKAISNTMERSPELSSFNAEYENPQLLSILTEIPNTFGIFLKKSFSKESVGPWLGILGTTGLLYTFDNKILSFVHKNGADYREEKYNSLINYQGHHLLKFPANPGAFLYFLGDGWIPSVAALGFMGTGYIAQNNKAAWTGIQILHAGLIAGAVDQILKRSFGRESPSARTSSRGTFRPFPNLRTYQKHVSRYDAMPSGHIMSATLGWTIIIENYPEYKPILLPIAVT